MADIPQSRTEEILYATINGEEYTGLPESRIEELLLELKEVIEEGGGGGGGTSTIAWKPTVAADGTISWVRTASETKPEDQNIKGPKGDDGTDGTDGEDGADGLGIKLVTINQQGHLIITFDDDTTQDAGAIPGGGGAVDSVNGKTGAVTLDAEDVGAVPTTAVGSTVASLTDGKVPASQLPSYVDDVVEAEDAMHFPVTGESGKIYVALDTNKSYRWSGSGYVEISESLALGETSSTAYAGNKGKANADAIDAIKDGTTIDSFSDVESALADKVDKVSGKSLSTNDFDNYYESKLDNIQPSANRIFRNSYTLNVSSWTQAQVGYEYEIDLDPLPDASFGAKVKLGTITNNNYPSDDEIYAYNECIEGGYLFTDVIGDNPSSTLTIYATEVPYRKEDGTSIPLKIWVEGLVKEV